MADVVAIAWDMQSMFHADEGKCTRSTRIARRSICVFSVHLHLSA